MAELVREAVDQYLSTTEAAAEGGEGLGLIGALGDLERSRDVGARHDRHLGKARMGDPPPRVTRATRAARKRRTS